MSQTDPILHVTDNARDKILRVRAQEGDPASLALWVEISGITAGSFDHKLGIRPLGEAGDDHVVQHHDDLAVVVPVAQVDDLRGASVTIDGDPAYGAVVVVNPNKPASPAMAGLSGDLSGDLAQRVSQVLDTMVNPSIAAHGGRAELVAVEEDTAYLRLSGGCQGCGLAKVTLSQGIEVAITDHVPEIQQVVDVTDHAEGANPYFESAKK
ncbi:MAG: NifU family protein [Nitriliruptorales bacterium]